MHACRTVSVLGLKLALLSGPLAGQGVPVRSLSNPDAACERGFTKVVGVKEMRDGRVILVDEIERLILRLDPSLREGTPIGNSGSGPGEYLVPDRLFSLVGDSSAVRDARNRRLLMITPDGEPGGVVSFLPFLGSHNLRASDGLGRLYFPREGTIYRWDPSASTMDTVAVFDSGTRTTTPTSLEEQNPFAPQTRWAVAGDGRLAFIHPDPYRVELLDPEGTRLEGPTVPFDPIEVTEGHKAEWRRRMTLPRVGLVWEPNRWPKVLPPFLPQNLGDAVSFDLDGRLWVQRTTPVGAPSTFDVFDSAGRRVEQVTLPPGRRLVGFGRGAVYTVFKDEFDLEYLERYRIGG